MSSADPPVWDPRELPPVPVRRFTVEEYHRMIRAGLFAEEERFELLEGWIVPGRVRTPPCAAAIGLAREAFRDRLPAAWHVRMRSALTTADSEPEPDLAIVRGAARDDLDGHPGPRDTALVVQVAEASPARDRWLKGRIYARAGIPAYWIINLAESKVEVYADPTGPDPTPGYRQFRGYGVDEPIPLVIDGQDVGPIGVRELLP